MAVWLERLFAKGYAFVAGALGALPQRDTLAFLGSSSVVGVADDEPNARSTVTIYGYAVVLQNGSPLPRRSKINFIGASAVDDVFNDTTIVTISGAPPAPGPIVTAVVVTNGNGPLASNQGFSHGHADAIITVSSTVGVSGVAFNGTPAAYFDIVDSTHIHAYTAAGTAGTGNVAVTNASGTGYLVNGWTYVDYVPNTHFASPTFSVDPSSIVHVGGNANSWTDTSGAGRLTPVAAGFGTPGYAATGGPNGGPCVTSNGTQAFDCGSGTPSTTKYFVCLLTVKATSLGAYQIVFGKQTASFNWAIMGQSGGNHQLSCYGDTVGPDEAYSRVRLDDGNWHWVVMIWDGTSMSGGLGTVRLIIDGEVQVSRRPPTASVLPTSSDHVGILGSLAGSPYIITGSMDRIHCYESRLPGITDLYGFADYFQRVCGISTLQPTRSSSPGVGALGFGDFSKFIDSAGNLDVEVTLAPTVSPDSALPQPSAWAWQATNSGGTMGVQYDSSTDQWHGVVNGSTVVTVANGSTQNGGTSAYFKTGDSLKIRFVYAPTSLGAENKLIFTINGVSKLTPGVAATGGAMAAVTAATLGSAIGGGSAFGSSAASLVCRSSLANTTLEGKYEGLLVGDSITSRETQLSSQDRYILTAVEASHRPGLRSISVPGLTLVDELAIYESDFCQGDPFITWIRILVGINEIFGHSQSEATIASAWNAGYAEIKSSNHFAKLLVQSTTPYNNAQTQYGVWKAILADMGVTGYSGGSHPISGWDWLDMATSLPPLNDGTDALAAAYCAAAGGPPHFNDAGNVVLAGTLHAALRLHGML